MNYSDSLTKFRQLNWLDKVELQKELDFFLEIAERRLWDIDDETIAYMNRLQGVINSLS
jgi:hypothetical protein